MNKGKALSKSQLSSDGFSPSIDLKNLVIFAPLALITVFCLSFAQMKAMDTQDAMRQEAAASIRNSNMKPLPLITQPELPKLNGSVETKVPNPVTPPMNPYMSGSQKSDKIGPSSTNAGNALQPNSGNTEKKFNDELQATRKTIRLEEAKF
jgi:hypothetical protein